MQTKRDSGDDTSRCDCEERLGKLHGETKAWLFVEEGVQEESVVPTLKQPPDVLIEKLQAGNAMVSIPEERPGNLRDSLLVPAVGHGGVRVVVLAMRVLLWDLKCGGAVLERTGRR